MTTYGFHPDALLEYAEATNYYLREASPEVAETFIGVVESAIASILVDPVRWRVVEEPSIRRHVFRRPFPYVIYYRWERELEPHHNLRCHAYQPRARLLERSNFLMGWLHATAVRCQKSFAASATGCAHLVATASVD